MRLSFANRDRPATRSRAVDNGTGHARERGQALVEFALVLIPLALILLGILQFFFIFGAQIGLTNAAREGARYAAATVTDTSLKANTNGPAVCTRLTGTIVPNNVRPYIASNLVTSSNAGGAPATRISYESYQDPAGTLTTWSVRVKVEVQYRHPLIIPLIAAILDGLDGKSDNALQVGAQVEMRVDNPALASDPAVAYALLCPP